MKLDSRLETIASFVRGGFICDVGTDHGKLPIYLLKNRVCERAVLSDINLLPLETAKRNTDAAGVGDRVEFIQTDGLTGISLDGITDIVIAGMGGELIADILAGAGESIKGINLILQPMTKRDFLLNFLLFEGFRIEEKVNVKDVNKEYTIINTTLVRDMRATVKKIYSALDAIAPFKFAEEWDNSGLLVGDFSDDEVNKILIALDISFNVVEEAITKNCEVIISHHPVIFHPLTKLLPQSPSSHAMKNDIYCICSHTSFDSSEMGMNNIFIPMFTKHFGIDHVYNKTPIEPTSDNNGIGIIFELPKAIETTTADFAQNLKEMFGSNIVKYIDVGEPLSIKRIAFCSGAGGEYLARIMDESLADAYITADLKHSHFIDAKGRNYPLFDCGHFATEAMMKEYAAKILQKQFPKTEFIIAETDTDPVAVI
ncbi:MAG: Nif3-like dinuclear metal center hexameric protein [Ruminococcus sp.]|nr:Nif3-like dinuclear metal center hexameric protein [Ruminococcus sp.]